MKLKLSKRTAALVLALIAAAGVVTGRERSSMEIGEPRTGAARSAAAPAELDLSRLARVPAAAPQGDPFAARSFAPPAQQAPVRGQAQPAAAPPLPFKYFGRLSENGKTEIFVLRGEELIRIAAGTRIDAEYRVDAVGATSISFTYLPLKTRQSLELAEGDV